MNRQRAGGQLSQAGRAESKQNHAGAAESKGSKVVSDLQALPKAERKGGSYEAGAKQVASPVPSNSAVSSNAAAVDDLLKEVKEKHTQALTNLHNIVDGYKLKKVKSLDDRLMLKKLQLADRKKAAESANSDVDLDTERRLIIALEDEIGGIQTEIEEAHANAERNKEGFVLFPSYGASLLYLLVIECLHQV